MSSSFLIGLYLYTLSAFYIYSGQLDLDFEFIRHNIVRS